MFLAAGMDDGSGMVAQGDAHTTRQSKRSLLHCQALSRIKGIAATTLTFKSLGKDSSCKHQCDHSTTSELLMLTGTDSLSAALQKDWHRRDDPTAEHPTSLPALGKTSNETMTALRAQDTSPLWQEGLELEQCDLPRLQEHSGSLLQACTPVKSHGEIGKPPMILLNPQYWILPLRHSHCYSYQRSEDLERSATAHGHF